MIITKDNIVNWLLIFVDNIIDNKDNLNALDRDIGDGDHGTNMSRGALRIKTEVELLSNQNTNTLLKNIGQLLYNSVGGASGCLYGTFFNQLSNYIGNRDTFSLEELFNGLNQGCEGVVQRGKANLGDKTMCDVLTPVVTGTLTDIQSGMSAHQVMQNMVVQADVKAMNTIEMIAKKGRASYLGKRSVGFQDPGATSANILFLSLNKALV
ncbi:dihydroxyacetone kinase subunit L [Vibrio sp. SS-MA-C1-2]|uniref:dihydroxyacetone kinase subunit DhaL n=1 Tax=Vibrio sp. SS-MA-C1-2 TaxID=2908646 RepID=UPI001F1A4654|nr:dihydroxyacetone kinase subunit DhaL [Vibrio sp. SS-MA-C1-2]UJF18427.1 dihydroxyacetone kinase subunit L [Vibrio sp. SS-MA-C1-2]